MNVRRERGQRGARGFAKSERRERGVCECTVNMYMYIHVDTVELADLDRRNVIGTCCGFRT